MERLPPHLWNEFLCQIGEWGKIFSYQAMTLATIDRLVHHATILEMNVESFRRKQWPATAEAVTGSVSGFSGPPAHGRAAPLYQHDAFGKIESR
jgi:IstB-like ATP binding protein